MPSVHRLSEPTALHYEREPDPLCGMGRPVSDVDAKCGLEEVEDTLVYALGELPHEVRPDMPQPVVPHELEAPHRQNPQYLPCRYLRVWPPPWVEELLWLVEPSCDGPHLQHEVTLDKELGPNGDITCCDAIVGGATCDYCFAICVLEHGPQR